MVFRELVILRADANRSFTVAKLTYLDFRSSLAFFFSLMDFDGFFLTSFLASLDFAIINLAFERA